MFNIDELIKEKGLTITKVMEVMGIPRATLRDLRKKNKSVRLPQIQATIKLYKYCNVKPAEILKILEEEGK